MKSELDKNAITALLDEADDAWPDNDFVDSVRD